MNRTEKATSAIAPESEMAILGAILQGHDTLKKVRVVVNGEDFYRDSHQLIYDVACDIADFRGEAVDLITVTDELRRRKKLEEIGSGSYLASLIDAVPTTSNVMHYARLVAEAAHARRVSQAALDLYVAAHAQEVGWQGQYEAVKLMMEQTAPGTDVGICRLLGDVLDEVARESIDDKGPLLVPAYWPSLTRYLCGGLAPGDLCYVGARPRIGKSAMMLEWARWLAQKNTPVMIVSCEMSLVALGRRIVSQAGAVVASVLRRGHLCQDDYAAVRRITEQFRNLPVAMVSKVRTVAQIEQVIAKQRIKPSLLFVDYLQLLSAKGRDKRERIETISSDLKSLAVTLNIPIVCLSSLRRPQGEAKDPPPTLSDLRESGELEHDADVVLLLHRPMLPTGVLSNDAICIVAKARDAEMGTVKMRFDPAYLRYSEITEARE